MSERAEKDAPRVTYSIEGYYADGPVELHNYSPYWGGYEDVDEARRWLRPFMSGPHRFRLVRVTREVVEYVPPPADCLCIGPNVCSTCDDTASTS